MNLKKTLKKSGRTSRRRKKNNRYSPKNVVYDIEGFNKYNLSKDNINNLISFNRLPLVNDWINSNSTFRIENFKIFGNKIGSGSFGDIFKGINLKNGNLVAIKTEKKDKKICFLDKEIYIYNKLKNHKFIPRIHLITETNCYKIIIMDYLGPTLEELFKQCNRKFSLKTTLMLGIQLINIIEKVHLSGVVHRDIKPDNFLIGYGCNKKKLYIIDFGLSSLFINTENYQHKKYEIKKQFIGTYRYSSLWNHIGVEQSRRDDLESIIYMLMYLYSSNLPWCGISGENQLKKIYNLKKNIPTNKIIKNCPKCFYLALNYIRRLKFDECPNYDYLSKLFKSSFNFNRFRFDYNYDWIIKKKRQNL